MRYAFIIMIITLNFIGSYAEAKNLSQYGILSCQGYGGGKVSGLAIACRNEVNRAFKDSAKEFKNKFELNFLRTATDNSETLKRISVYFNYPKVMKPENTRVYLLEVLNLCLEKINQDPELQKYLFEHPLGRENLDITIYVPSQVFGSCAIMGWNNKAFSYLLNDGKGTSKEEPYE